MTKQVVVEGVLHADGRMIEKDALYIEGERLPVYLSSDREQTVGWATNMVKNDEGAIKFDIEVFSQYDHWFRDMAEKDEIDKWYDFALEASDIEWKRINEGKGFLITKGRMRAVCIIPIPGFPKSL
jgi:hypothetical protein